MTHHNFQSIVYQINMQSLTRFHVLIVVLSAQWRQSWSQNQTTPLPENPCFNGGTCSDFVNEVCTGCNCTLGFTGSMCGEHLTRIDGQITYNTSEATGSFTTNTSVFQDALKTAYADYQSSTVTMHNSTTQHSYTLVYTVYITKPVSWSTFDLEAFRSNIITVLSQPSVTSLLFSPPTGIAVSSASLDIDECSSQLYTCSANARCFNQDPGYQCTCNEGYSGNGTVCIEIYCILSKAPKWPSSAKRTVSLRNGTDIRKSTYSTVVPYKTFIEYECPAGYLLSSADTGEAQAIVIECVGSSEPTHEQTGWTGGNVICAMELQFTVAICIAAISSAIIVLVAGGFIVSWTKKDKKKDDQDVLEEISS